MSEKSQFEFIKRLSYVLDSSIPVPGTRYRVGLDPIIGLIPGIGDALTSLISTYIVFVAMQMRVSRWTLTRMIFNILVESIVGIAPIVGDIFDAMWKSNERNILLLDKNMNNPSARAADKWFIVGAGLVLALIFAATAFAAFELLRWLVSLL